MRRLTNPLFLLAVVAAVLASTVVYVVLGDEDQVYETDDVFPETVVVNPDMVPKFTFPDELRSTNLELNRFVDRFFRVCGEGRYSEFKLMYTNMPGQEIPPERFESTFNVLKSATIKELRQLPALKQFEGPTWLLVATYELEPFAPAEKRTGKVIRLAIGREDDRWKLLGPITKDALDQIEAYEKATRASASATTAPRS